MYTFNITFNVYDDYGASVLTGSFRSLHENYTPQDIKNAVQRIMKANNWSAGLVRSITVYRA